MGSQLLDFIFTRHLDENVHSSSLKLGDSFEISQSSDDLIADRDLKLLVSLAFLEYFLEPRVLERLLAGQTFLRIGDEEL